MNFSKNDIKILNSIPILYIEDDLTIAKTFLNIFNYQTIFNQNIKHITNIKDCLLQDLEKYKLIISDLNLEDGSGFSFIEEIRKVNKDIPIIIISAYSESEKILKALNLGVNAYMIKPIIFKDLLENILKYSYYYTNHEHLKKSRNKSDNFISLNNHINEINQEEVLGVLISIENIPFLNNSYGYKFVDQIIEKFKTYLQDFCMDGSIHQVSGNKFLILKSDVNEEKYQKIKNEFGINKNKNNILYKIFNFINSIEKTPFKINDIDIYLNLICLVGVFNKNNIVQKLKDLSANMQKNDKKIYLISNNDYIKLEQKILNNLNWVKILNETINNTIYNLNTTDKTKHIEDNIFQLVYQPIVNNFTYEIEKHEALMRLKYNNIIYDPIQFLDLAKDLKIYKKIQNIVLRLILNKIRETKKDISFNISFSELQEDSANIIYNLLEENKDITKHLNFEILESENVVNINILKSFIKNIKKYNCKIGLDDFGVAFSNLNLLLENDLSFDFIKFDGDLIKNIHQNEKSYDIVSNTLNFTKKYNIHTIAEFVENQEILDKLQELGISSSQGYHIYKPLNDLI